MAEHPEQLEHDLFDEDTELPSNKVQHWMILWFFHMEIACCEAALFQCMLEVLAWDYGIYMVFTLKWISSIFSECLSQGFQLFFFLVHIGPMSSWLNLIFAEPCRAWCRSVAKWQSSSWVRLWRGIAEITKREPLSRPNGPSLRGKGMSGITYSHFHKSHWVKGY